MEIEDYEEHNESDFKCPTCTKNNIEYTYVLSPMQQHSLDVFAKYGGLAKVSALELENSPHNNFTKLQHWGLIRKHIKLRATWEMTELGWAFHKGQAKIFEKVEVYMNRALKFKGEKIYMMAFYDKYEPHMRKDDYLNEAQPH